MTPREPSYAPESRGGASSPNAQNRVEAESQRGAVAPVVREVLAKPGQTLDATTRAWIEPRLGFDFSQVRIHADERAAQSAESLGALAYTLGRDVVFGAGRYQPQSRAGRQLLAHELAHVVQQGDRPIDLQSRTEVSVPGNHSERAADLAARAAMADMPPRSAALALRDSLRSGAPLVPTMQRVVKTWGGEWDTDLYKRNVIGGVDEGVQIDLRFKPGDPVDAESIAMVQTANSIDTGKVLAINPTVGARSIPAGKGGEGIHIDQAEYNRSPLYAVEKAPAKDKSLTATAPNKFWGRHGFRFTDKAGNLQKRDAKLHDETNLAGHGANSSQTYETTAVAIKGEQVGTYYGSVRWGWRSDATNTFQRLPLSKGSDDVPSGRFASAAALFNKTKTSVGDAPLQLKVASGRYATDVDTPLVTDPTDAAGTEIDKLGKNARVEVTDKGWGKAFNKGKDRWWKVTAVDGTYIGKVGWVMASKLSPKKS